MAIRSEIDKGGQEHEDIAKGSPSIFRTIFDIYRRGTLEDQPGSNKKEVFSLGHEALRALTLLIVIMGLIQIARWYVMPKILPPIIVVEMTGPGNARAIRESFYPYGIKVMEYLDPYTKALLKTETFETNSKRVSQAVMALNQLDPAVIREPGCGKDIRPPIATARITVVSTGKTFILKGDEMHCYINGFDPVVQVFAFESVVFIGWFDRR